MLTGGRTPRKGLRPTIASAAGTGKLAYQAIRRHDEVTVRDNSDPPTGAPLAMLNMAWLP
jgi:hypothetical protein